MSAIDKQPKCLHYGCGAFRLLIRNENGPNPISSTKYQLIYYRKWFNCLEHTHAPPSPKMLVRLWEGKTPQRMLSSPLAQPPRPIVLDTSSFSSFPVHQWYVYLHHTGHPVWGGLRVHYPLRTGPHRHDQFSQCNQHRSDLAEAASNGVIPGLITAINFRSWGRILQGAHGVHTPSYAYPPGESVSMRFRTWKIFPCLFCAFHSSAILRRNWNHFYRF